MSDIFLSYSREDLAFAKQLAGTLETFGWSVWWDKKIPAGKTFANYIKEHLDESRCVIVIWSLHSVQSDWVQLEAAEGARRKILAPVIIENAEIPFEFQRIQALNLSEWDGTTVFPDFQELIVSVQYIVPLPVKQEVSRKEKEAAKESKGTIEGGYPEQKKTHEARTHQQFEEREEKIPEVPPIPAPVTKSRVNFRHILAFIITVVVVFLITYLAASTRGGSELGDSWYFNLIFWGFIGAFAYDVMSRDKKSRKFILIPSLIFLILFIVINYSERRIYYDEYSGAYHYSTTYFWVIYKSFFYSIPWGAMIGMIIFSIRNNYLKARRK